MFLISKCRGDWDLGLRTTSGLAFGKPQRNDKFRFFLRRNTFFCRKSPLRCGSPNASPEVVHRLDLSLLYILILGTYSKFAQKNNFLSLGVCFLQPCSSAGRMIAVSRSRLQYYWRIVSFPQQKVRWNAFWTGFHWESAFVREIPNPTLINTLKLKKKGKQVWGA